MSRPPLPPLPSIRVFEAAARLGNFTRAAEELGLTQAAVSHQIKVLEERVGAPLFERRPRGVAPTRVGAALLARVGPALDAVAEAYAEARGETRRELAISVIPTFASQFLSRRLGCFQLVHPEIAVRIEMSEALVDLGRSEFDMAIRGGKGDWPGLVSHKLIETVFAPMLSPRLIEESGPVETIADLLALPILSHGDPWWRNWLICAGAGEIDLSDRPEQSFGSQLLEAGAAIGGQGVAMLTPALFAEEVAAGLLVQPFDLTCSDGSAFWLCTSESRRNTRNMQAFARWLRAEIADVSAV